MEKLLQTGKVKAIGVANFSVPYLQELMKTADVTPAANQIENHPYLPGQEIRDYCRDKGIHVTAYSPLGSTGGPLFKEEGVQKVAQKHDVSPATVLLSYHGMSVSIVDVQRLIDSGHRAVSDSQVGEPIAHRG